MSLFQSRVRGKIDSNGVASALLEERLSMGLNFLLSAEVRSLTCSCAETLTEYSHSF